MESFISPPSRCHRRHSFLGSCELQVVSYLYIVRHIGRTYISVDSRPTDIDYWSRLCRYTDRQEACRTGVFFFAFYRRREKSARRARTTSDIFILSSNPHTVIKQISQWRCIVFVVVFSIQELNALFSMGLCGNFYLNHLIISLNVTRDECKSVWSKVVSIDKSRFDRRQESVRSKTVTIA